MHQVFLYLNMIEALIDLNTESPHHLGCLVMFLGSDNSINY